MQSNILIATSLLICLATLESIAQSAEDLQIIYYNVLNWIEIGIADYETSGIITSNQLIGSSARVDYDAAVEINLNFPFHVNAGAVFEAFIDGCNQGDGGLNKLVRKRSHEVSQIN